MSIEANDETKPPLSYRVKTQGFRVSGLLKTESITRQSPDGSKLHQVILFYHGEEGTEPKSIPSDIKIASYMRSKFGRGWYFDNAIQQWNGSYEDASLLRDVIDDKFPDSGKYQQLTGDAAIDGLAQSILAGEMPAESADKIIRALVENPEAHEVFRNSDASQILASTVDRYHQQQALQNIDSVARDPTSNENDLQRILSDEWWIFGGRFIDQAKRRSLTVLDQLDVPLIRGDGSLQIVELKQANIPRLVKRHRSHIVVGDAIHEAVSQSMNYLLALDEQRAQILTDLGIDARRASATVVVGHSAFVSDFTREEVLETIRTYNSHLSRVEVVTYDELVAGAQRSIDFSSE